MGVASNNMLILRLLIIALFVALALLLSSTVTRSKYFRNRTRNKSFTSPSPSPSCFLSMKCDRLPPSVSKAMIYYATSNVTLHQTIEEINMTASVLAERGPCNMLVFGLGDESVLWAALNSGGRTVFVEDDQERINSMRDQHPELESHFVDYPNDTMVSDAYTLLKNAEGASECMPSDGDLEFSRCKLALQHFPAQIYNTEWDVIMIDAPAGYYPEAPGRMQVIYSSALMAINGRGNGETDVFVHDVARTVERMYSEAFLCAHNLVDAGGSLWHFKVPAKPAANTFCST